MKQIFEDKALKTFIRFTGILSFDDLLGLSGEGEEEEE